MTAEFEKTNRFLREHAGRALGQAIVSRDDIVLQQDTPPPLEEIEYALDNEELARDREEKTKGLPLLSDMVNELERDEAKREKDLKGRRSSPDLNLDWLNEKANEWLAEHFPNIDAGFTTLPSDWIADVLASSENAGVSLGTLNSVWDQSLTRMRNAGQVDKDLLGVDFSEIWVKGRDWVRQVMPDEDSQGRNVYKRVFDRARDRAEDTRRSEFRNIEAGYAARGFSLPPGAMVAALDEATQRSIASPLEVDVEQAVRQAEIAQGLDQVALQTASQQATALADTRASARTESFRAGSSALEKNADIQADFVRVAAQLATQIAYQFKVSILQAMAEFHRSWIGLLNEDPTLGHAKQRADILADLYQEVRQFHQVDTEFERLRLAAEQARVGIVQLENQNQIEIHSLRERSADSLGQAVRGFGDISAAAANAAGSLTAQIESI